MGRSNTKNYMKTHYDTNGATTDVYYDISKSMLENFEMTMLNTGTANIVLRADNKINPFNHNGIKIHGKGGQFTVVRKGDEYYVKNTVGEVLNFG